jgi:nucleotide-binding universal stress UspA family protein
VKVLIAIDDSDVSRKAVAFAARILGRRVDKDVEITLFHVVESLPEYILARSYQGGAGSAFRQVAEEWAESNRTNGERLLTEQRQALVTAGFPTAQLHTKMIEKEGRPESRRVITALAIIEEMKGGGYDIVVIGRRGASAAIETFLGSVAEKIAREAQGCTLWIVD